MRDDMQENGYFESFDQNLHELVEQYERMVTEKQSCYLEESSFEQIISYYEESGRPVQAMQAVDDALEQYPFSSEFHVRKAELLFDEQKFDEALEYLSRAEVFDPSDINIALLRSDIYLWLSDHNAAIDTIKSAIKAADQEELSDLYLELADIYEDWEKYDKVYKSLKKALRVDPENEEALRRMWFSVEFSGNHEDSQKFHAELLEEYPYSYLAWYNLGCSYVGLGEKEKAIEAFEYAFTINDKFDNAIYECAETCKEIGHYTKALDLFLECVPLVKPFPELFLNIGECYESMDQFKKARQYYRKATNFDPYLDEAVYRIGCTYMMEDNFELACQSFQRALKIEPCNVIYLEAIALASKEMGDMDSAIAAFEKIIELEPNTVHNWIQLAQYQYETGMEAHCLDLLETAIDFFPNNADLHYYKAAYHLLAGEIQEGLCHLQIGLSANFDQHTIIFAVAKPFERHPAVMDIIERYKPVE